MSEGCSGCEPGCKVCCSPRLPFLRRQLLAVAQRLAELAAPLEHAVRGGGSSAAPSLRLHFQAGCKALLGVLVLAGRLPELSSQAAYNFSAACSLVFGPGTALFEALAFLQ